MDCHLTDSNIELHNDINEFDTASCSLSDGLTVNKTPSQSSTTGSASLPVPHTMNIGGVPGLIYIPNFVSVEEQSALMSIIDQAAWDTTLKRRVQHYGYRYDYSTKKVDTNALPDPLPDFLSEVVERLHQLCMFDRKPDQCIVNEYLPGQGINPHIDRMDSFGPVVASISLGSSAVMTFSSAARSVDVLLEPLSMVLLTGDSRTVWKHSIAPRKKDNVNGVVLQRDRRISLTFRTVKRVVASSSS